MSLVKQTSDLAYLSIGVSINSSKMKCINLAKIPLNTHKDK